MTAADLFDGLPLSYAEDDGMPFPGWAPPPLSADEAAERYDAGDRFAVLAGQPTDPAAALVVDVRNGRVVVTQAEPRQVLVFAGKKDLVLTEAAWPDGSDAPDDPHEWRAETRSTRVLRLRRRPLGAPVWVDELLARAPEPVHESWPEFGDWRRLARIERDGPQWWSAGTLEPVDADGWLLEELGERGIAERWRELARKQDAPRAYSQPPEVQAKLAEPLGWRAQGRRWRRTAERRGTTLVTDVSFVAGAGGGSDVAFTVTRGDIEVALGLPAATSRWETRELGAPRNPSQPRPSASAQVGITAVLQLAGEAHDVIAAAIDEGAVPDGWARLVATG